MGSCWPYNCFFFYGVGENWTKGSCALYKIKAIIPTFLRHGGHWGGQLWRRRTYVGFYVCMFMNLCTWTARRWNPVSSRHLFWQPFWGGDKRDNFQKAKLFNPLLNQKLELHAQLLTFIIKTGSCSSKKNLPTKICSLQFEKQLLRRPGTCVCSWWAPWLYG